MLRAVPPIVLLLIVYSALPYSGIVLFLFATGVLTLTLIETAYLSEVFRCECLGERYPCSGLSLVEQLHQKTLYQCEGRVCSKCARGIV